MEGQQVDGFSELHQDVEEAVWQIHEILTQLRGLRNPLDDRHENDENVPLHEEEQAPNHHHPISDASASTSSSTITSHGQRSCHQEVRRWLTQLNREIGVLEEAVARYTASNNNNNDDDNDDETSQDDPFLPGISSSLRTCLLGILIEIDLMELGVQDDYRIHQLHHQVCGHAYAFLDRWCLRFQDLQAVEAMALFERVVDFVNQRQGEHLFFQSSHEEMATFGLLLSLVNGAYASDDADNDLEEVLGDGGPVLEVLYLFLPAAIASFEQTSWESIQQQKNATSNNVFGQLWIMVNALLLYVSQRIAMEEAEEPGLCLAGWLQQKAMMTMNQERGGQHELAAQDIAAKADHKTNLILTLVQTYASKLLDFTLDVLDSAANSHPAHTSAAAGMDNGSTDDSYTSCERHGNQPAGNHYHDMIFHAIHYASFACTALKLVTDGRRMSDDPSDDRSKATSTRSLWMAYAKFFLATNVVEMSGDDTIDAWCINIFVKIASLVLGDGRATEVRLTTGVDDASSEASVHDLDHGLQHALSITFLSALDFPEVLLGNSDFLAMIENIAAGNDELRHLVQGVALRQLVMSTSGTARDPAGMEQVTQCLIKIAMQTAKTEPSQVKDPWDQFFRDQLAKLTCVQITAAASSNRGNMELAL